MWDPPGGLYAGGLVRALRAREPRLGAFGRWVPGLGPCRPRLLHPLLTVTASTDDAAEGIAAFTEKRPPEWTGR